MNAVTYRRGSTADRAALEGLLGGLTPESAYARFQAALGSVPPPAVVDALMPDGTCGGTVLAWDGDDLVAHGVWVRLGASRVAEIAIVVADTHQRKGIGTVLADRLVHAADAAGIQRVEVFSVGSNRAVARMVARSAPDARRERDGMTVAYSVDVHARRVTSLRSASADGAAAAPPADGALGRGYASSRRGPSPRGRAA
jgi:GNAT superfamily N-acetyltransferase